MTKCCGCFARLASLWGGDSVQIMLLEPAACTAVVTGCSEDQPCL